MYKDALELIQRFLPNSSSLARTRMNTDVENELSMLVQYFLRFGAKGGRDGLTLQARRDRNVLFHGRLFVFSFRTSIATNARRVGDVVACEYSLPVPSPLLRPLIL